MLRNAMMRKPKLQKLKLADLLRETELVPHAVVAKPVSYFERRLGHFVQSHDDLDFYEGAAFSLDGLPFALIHYRGTPKNSVTIYLSRTIKDHAEISGTVSRISEALDLPAGAIVWQRTDGPDL
jgi:hypothetical protein